MLLDFNDAQYFAGRAQQELTRAQTATQVIAQRVHLELAQLYEQKSADCSVAPALQLIG